MSAPSARPPCPDRFPSGSAGAGYRGLLPALVALLLVAVAVPVIAMRRDPPVSQPVAFSHKKHTVDVGLGCEFCHKYFKTSAHSGLPDEKTCGMCHSVLQGESPQSAELTEMLGRGESLQFNKLFRLPDYVFYTHRRHVGIAELECVNCHDGIAETEVPPQRPLIEIKMAFCVDCHEERDVTTDCTACHR